MENHEPTNQELKDSINAVLEAVNAFAGTVDDKFAKIDERFDRVDLRLNKIEATMVTKDYLDDKLAIRKADLILIDRKQEEKVDALVNKLEEKKVLSAKEAVAIKRLSPFPVKPVV